MREDLSMSLLNDENFRQSGDAAAQELVQTNLTNGNSNENSGSKTTFERGASWSYPETALLLYLWGQDVVQKQLENCKRTRHVWGQIAEQICEQGFERSAGRFCFLLFVYCLLFTFYYQSKFVLVFLTCLPNIAAS